MNRTTVDLVALSHFALVAAHGGFGRAERAGGPSKGTLSRRVAQLEVELGTRLIERGSRSLRLTEAGELLFRRMEAVLTDIAEIRGQIGGNDSLPSGKLRISAPLVFSHVHLGALAADFGKAYPEVRLEATTENRLVDLIEEGYDAVIRVNPPDTTDLVGKCFMRDRVVVVSTSTLRDTYCDKDWTPAILPVGVEDNRMWHIETGEGTRGIEARSILCLPSLLMIRDAAIHNAGAAALPRSLVEADLLTGRLVNWGDLRGGSVEIWVLHTSRRLANGKVMAFVDFLTNRFR